MKSRSKLLAIGISVFIIFVSCYERKEGCLNLLSDNYDVTSDDECSDCCTYPKLAIAISPVNGVDSTYTLSDTIYTLSGDSVQLIEAKLYLSGITIFDSGNQIKSSISIIDSASSKSYHDDVVFLRPQDKTLNTGQFIFAGEPDSIICHLGLNTDLVNGVFNQSPNAHPLNFRNKLVDDTDGIYSYGYLKYRTIAKGTFDTVNVHITKPLYHKMKWTEVAANNPGYSLKVKIQADYGLLMSQIKRNMTVMEAESAILENLTRFLTVK